MCVRAKKKKRIPWTMADDHSPRKCASIILFLYEYSSDKLTKAVSDVINIYKKLYVYYKQSFSFVTDSTNNKNLDCVTAKQCIDSPTPCDCRLCPA